MSEAAPHDQPPRRPWLRQPVTVFLGFFVALLAYNIQALNDPPYWDALLGIFNQSLWLADHDFDYAALLEQERFWRGGALISPLYVLAPVYAAMFKLLSPAAMWPLCHVMNLGLAALALALLYALLEERLGAGLSLLWCLALALDPIWSGQCAAIYLEIPQAAVFLLALRAFDRGRFKSAALWCALGYLVKPSGLLLALAFAVYVPGRLLLARLFRAGEERAGPPPRAAWWLAAPLLPLLGIYASQEPPPFARPAFFDLLAELAGDAPQQLAALGLLVILCAAALIGGGARRALLRHPKDLDLALLLGALVFGFWSSYFVHSHPLARYSVALWAPALLALALLSKHLVGPRRAALIPAVLALLGAVNQHGLLLPEIEPRLRRSGDRLERSREFLDDLEANRRLCRALDERVGAAPVLARFPFIHSLSRPELGYVSRPLNTVAFRPTPDNTGAAELTPALLRDPKLHVVYAPNSFEASQRLSLRPPAGAIIVMESRALGAPVVVYRRGD